MSTQHQHLTELKERWGMLFPKVAEPQDSQWALWLFRHDPTILREALLQLAEKYLKTGCRMELDHMARFLSAVANRLTAGAKEVKQVETIGMKSTQGAHV